MVVPAAGEGNEPLPSGAVAVAEEATPEAVAPAEPPTGPAEEPRHLISEWVITLIFLMFGITMLIQAFVIPSGSMMNTLLIGDHLLVDKLTYAPSGGFSSKVLPYRAIRRGDIIVFRYPIDPNKNYVKRVIGLPGDHVRIINGQLWINGKQMHEPYVIRSRNYIHYDRDFFPNSSAFWMLPNADEMRDKHIDKKTEALIVPDDCFFALGDNRDDSEDSRFWGFVPRRHIVGKPLVIYWSFEAPPGRYQDAGFSWEHTQDLLLHFFSKTRWSRTFRVVRGYPLE